jgi:hypothetical protein
VDGITAQRKKEQLLMKVLQQQTERLEEEKLQLKLEVSTESLLLTLLLGIQVQSPALYSLGGEGGFLLTKTKLHGLSPQVDYTDQVTATCRFSPRVNYTDLPLVGNVSVNFCG